MTFALVGNQNCGKTTLFNQLTGSNQHVGNFPGVTVEQKLGAVRSNKDITVVDLPGIYSMRPYTAEELVTRDFVLKNRPDGIINIIDATNIERNLYLTLQLLELKLPTVIALNMMDEVRGNGGSIDVSGLSRLLGVPCVAISASKNEGIDDLISEINKLSVLKPLPKVIDFCDDGAVHRCIHAAVHLIDDHAKRAGIPSRFAATKLIEGDKPITDLLQLNENELDLMEHSIIEMEAETELDRNAALADMRYTFIEQICSKTVVKCKESKERRRSVKIDSVLTHKYFAIPLFLGIMLTVFWLSFSVIGAWLSDLLTIGIDAFTSLTASGLDAIGINPTIKSLVIDGVFAGVGSVLSFLPTIIVLFFFLSILEDTGYMARIAFVMDKLLRKIGLSGRSIVPMLLGFGCSVPAIMATRTLSSERDRKMTILLTPFMSCSAKIPVYAMFAQAFFPTSAPLVMIALYLTGIVVGILVALIFNVTSFKGNPVPFVMELPNYRFPSAKTVVRLMYDKAKDFVQKAFTIIFAATVIIWALQTFDFRLFIVQSSSDSMLASIGRFISPIFTPLGLADWKLTTALITGLSAKEAVISTLAVLNGTSVEALAEVLTAIISPAQAISFLVFTLLYTPCIAAIAAMKRELGSGLKALGVVFMQCGIAWLISALTYQLCLIII